MEVRSSSTLNRTSKITSIIHYRITANCYPIKNYDNIGTQSRVFLSHSFGMIVTKQHALKSEHCSHNIIVQSMGVGYYIYSVIIIIFLEAL